MSCFRQKIHLKMMIICDNISAELFKMFEPLIGKQSIQYANGPGGRKRRQLTDRSFSHDAVGDYYEHFVMVNT